jgi:CheY-like chemotaxis protein
MLDEKEEALKSGLDGYLTKPINRAILYEVLAKLLAIKRSRKSK